MLQVSDKKFNVNVWMIMDSQSQTQNLSDLESKYKLIWKVDKSPKIDIVAVFG